MKKSFKLIAFGVLALSVVALFVGSLITIQNVKSNEVIQRNYNLGIPPEDPDNLEGVVLLNNFVDSNVKISM